MTTITNDTNDLPFNTIPKVDIIYLLEFFLILRQPCTIRSLAYEAMGL